MTNLLDQAVKQLAKVLAAENEALTAMDFASAGAMLAPKHAAADALAAALRASSSEEASPEALQELGALAEENRRLLNRAMRVQRRVLDLVAKAARAGQKASRYGPGGKVTPSSSPRSLTRRA